jgi:hypothetical protein
MVNVYNTSINDNNDFRFFSVLPLLLARGSTSSSDGHGGMTSVGSISLAPRATILELWRCCSMLALKAGTGGAMSGDGPRDMSLWRDLGRRMVDARRSLLGLAKLDEPWRGAVCGVVGVAGGILPLMRAS